MIRSKQHMVLDCCQFISGVILLEAKLAQILNFFSTPDNILRSEQLHSTMLSTSRTVYSQIQHFSIFHAVKELLS